MRTPAGTECRYYYEDFNRGREIQICRLIESNVASAPWRPRLCQTCPVPAILRANACPHMVLEGWVRRRWLVIPQVRVRAFCRMTQQPVAEPMVGCGHCQDTGWSTFVESLGQADKE